MRAWFGLSAPAGLPDPVLKRLNEASATAAQSKPFGDFAEKNGMSAVGGTSNEFANYLKAEQTRWRTVITEANIKLD